MKIDILQHVAYEGAGEIAGWCAAKNIPYEIHPVYETHQFPSAEEVGFLIVLGGPMSARDRLEWIEKERELILSLINQRKPILGICLGAQQIAKALGARIFTGEFREAGWLPIRTTSRTFDFLPEELTVFHWHGEQFELPEGAKRIFESEACKNQGFLYRDHVIGLQFHFEFTKEIIDALIEDDAEFLDGSPYTQPGEEMKAQALSEGSRNAFYSILDFLAQKA